MARMSANRSDVESALTRTLSSLAPGTSRVERLRLLTGGASLETWAFDAVGEGHSIPFILRRRGGDQEVMETSLTLPVEAALIAAAAQVGVPVAPVARLCGADDGLGEAYITPYVSGETLGRRIALDPSFAQAREKLGAQCGAALAQVHALDAGELPPLESMDAGTVLARYEAIWRKGGAVRPTIEAAFRWLYANRPKPAPPVVLHGDFRNGNLLVDPESGLAAVLDWELAHRGDPAEDLGWLCVNSWRFGNTALPVGGFATLDALLDGYAAAGGEPPAIARIRYWQAIGSLKWAVITNMMYRSFAEGHERSVERAVIGRRLSECEVDLLALLDGWQ